MPTISQVATRAGVSRTSAWLALNHKEGVSDELRQRVFDAVSQLESAHDPPSKPLKRDLTSILVLHSPYIASSEYFKGVLSGIQAAIHDSRIQLRMTALDTLSTHDSHISELYFSEPMLHPSGIITLSSDLTASVADRARQLQIPLVEVGYPHEPDDVSFVVGNDISAGQMATQHLLRLGHRAVAFIGHHVDTPHLKRRIEGYQQALQTAGIEPRADWLFLTSDRDLKAPLAAFIEQRPAVTAVLFINWYTSVEALRALYQAGYTIPDDLSAIVFDDFEHARTAALTAVAYPLPQMGSQAVNILVNHLREPLLDVTHHLLQTWLVQRASCAPPG